MTPDQGMWREADEALAQLRALRGTAPNDPAIEEARRKASSRLYELAREFPDRALGLLQTHVDDRTCAQDPTACGALVGGLVAAKHKDAAPTLARMLGSPEMAFLHEDLAEDLGNIGDVRALDALRQALDHPETWVRAKAARSLGQLGSKDATAPLLKALDDESEAVRLGAVRALAHLGAREATERLSLVAQTDEDEDVREAAMNTLDQLRA